MMRGYFKTIFVFGLIIFISTALFYPHFYKRTLEYMELIYIALRNDQIERNTDTLELQNLIAHAGGGIENLNLLNSLEALDLNYKKGFRFIELDFEWTSDGYLVLLHDWKKSMPRLFNASEHRYSLKAFLNLKMRNGMTNLSLDDLAEWIRRHPDVFIITDIKRDNIRALTKVKERFPWIVENLIPQIYHFYEYFSARDIGYKHIILTLYVAAYSDEAVLRFAKKYPLAAVTMPVDRALTDLPQKLKNLGVPTYAHTVNEASLQQELYINDVFGIYTDFLVP